MDLSFFFAHGLFDQFLNIKEFISSVDAFLQKELSAHQSAGEGKDSTDPRFDPQIQFASVYPDMLWRTTFLHAYFIAESALNSICENLRETHHYEVNLTDMTGKGIRRARLYLKKVCKLNVDSFQQDWNKLSDLCLVRNSLVHAEGDVSPTDAALALPKKYPGLQIVCTPDDKFASFELQKEFCLCAIDVIYTFFEKVQGSIWNSNNR